MYLLLDVQPHGLGENVPGFKVFGVLLFFLFFPFSLMIILCNKQDTIRIKIKEYMEGLLREKSYEIIVLFMSSVCTGDAAGYPSF